MTATIDRPTREAGTGLPTLAVKQLWKVFGPAENKVIGTPDADLTSNTKRLKHANTTLRIA